MRYAIIGDIHSNLAAFTAVLDDIEQQGGVDRIWCLGDIVGYGPDPHQCIELLRQTEHICVAGNHDWAAVSKVDTANFNPDAAAACHWTSGQLSAEDIKYLENLPLTIEEGDFTLVHGSPREPIWEYLFTTDVAEDNQAHFKSPFCLVGHTHVPLVFNYDQNGACSVSQFEPDTKLALSSNRLIINPGGGGQPRDNDPRASYAIYDRQAGTVSLCRVPYDIKSTQDRMTEYDLPTRLIARLSYGM